jgi:hypothetical protein
MGIMAVAASRKLGITGNPQYDGVPFTDFSGVNRRTQIDRLNLNWREKDLPERQRTKHVHRLHPYLGKFVPQLVEIFLRKYQPSVVCDPFSGSGTTLVEAMTLGIDSVGADISEFNCMLTRVKTRSYDLRLLEREINDILTRFALEMRPTLFTNGLGHEMRSASEYLQAWFVPKALGELLFYRKLIDDYTYQDVLKVILSRAARSARLTTHFDLDFPRVPQTKPYHCHKHRRTCRPTDDAKKFLVRYSLDTLRRIQDFASVRSTSRARVLCGDSRSIRFPKADMVITSPPYVGLIDYHEQHRYAYELLGLESRDDQEIGPASGGGSRTAVERYVDDMTGSFRNVVRSLAPGARIVVVVHDRRDLYAEIGERLGVETEYRLGRHVNRRTGRRATDFFEDVIVWRKK